MGLGLVERGREARKLPVQETDTKTWMAMFLKYRKTRNNQVPTSSGTDKQTMAQPYNETLLGT